MSSPLIHPDQLPTWVPGQLTVHSPEDGWDGISVRGYRYAGSDVEVPALRDYMIVAYLRGQTSMRRQVEGEWLHEDLGPGDVSLLTRAVESHWTWLEEIEVVHVYLGQDELASTCHEMYERDVDEVRLRDQVKADDPAIHRTAMNIAREAAQGEAGSSLLVEALSTELAVHILRRHADVVFREPHDRDGLSAHQTKLVKQYVEAHLGKRIRMEDLAGAVGLSRYHFARRFKQSAGTSPHGFVLQERVRRAAALLRSPGISLNEVAYMCGFADQSHLSREFKKRMNVTPGRFRSGT